ncbi:acyl-CoA dehydrogenase family protein [Saccharopolyspora sp. NPDC050389]|uniref:acyl-CoA dehydrogenase family protein n=1 Tax=Saccharopolyspora sp. NPDC050389 TaxID=3155516 RepID=UPI0033E0C74A
MDVDEFRARAREFLAANAPEPLGDRAPAELLREAKRFQAAAYDAGLMGITWPAEFGGQGRTAAEQQAYNEEAAHYDLPGSPFMVGMGMCGPTLLDLGTPEQKARYLPKLLRGDEIWCQLFSEPGAGSDVASLQTRAVREAGGTSRSSEAESGGEWVINGQKVWTSGAQWSDFGALLARTDPDVPKHRGITMFVIDMHAPGVTVRPLQDMTGRAPFNEVYFDDVRIPADSVIGEVGGGWLAAVTMLGHERVSIGGTVRRGSDPLAYDNLVELARRHGRAEDPVVRGRLAEIYAQERALGLFNSRLRQEAEAGSPPGARGSVSKLAGALLLWRAVDTAGLIAGAELAAWEPGDSAAEEMAIAINSTPASSIAGGSNQIQRNIIGERILGLPKEPQVDRDVPFRELKVGTQRPA